MASKCKKTHVKMAFRIRKCAKCSQNEIHFELFCYLPYNIIVDNRDSMEREE